MKKIDERKIIGYVAQDELGLICIQDYFAIIASSKRSMQHYLTTAGIDETDFSISPTQFIPIRLGLPDAESWSSAIGE